MSSPEKKINNLLDRIRRDENTNMRTPQLPSQFNSPARNASNRTNRPSLPLDNVHSSSSSPIMKRPKDLTFTTKRNDNIETEQKLREIMKISGNLTINGEMYKTDIKDMEDIEELGNGTCGHVIKMRHKPSGEVIAVKQMRRSGNSEETKRIIMDIEVVLKSHDCKYIVQCLGCFITESEVWICMELMATCFDKLLKRLKQPIPEDVLGKVTVATVEALSYLKDKHGVIHRDVKPSNILLDTKGNVKLCDFGISGRLVDSMAKTRSAGCAAYMAPERIEPDPTNPDYDIRADVWSLGITLVELATGKLPYLDCKTDFEVLTKVISQDPPTLPEDKEFSQEFRNFVKCCLIKDQKQRPKYVKLKNEHFIKKYEVAEVDVGKWFANAIQHADNVANRSAARRSPSPSTSRRLLCYQRYVQELQPQAQHYQALTNGSNVAIENQPQKAAPVPPFPFNSQSSHVSRISTFHSSNANHQRDSYLPYVHQRSPDRFNLHHQSLQTDTTPLRSYSPFQAYQNHKLLQQKNSPANEFHSPSHHHNNLSETGMPENQFSSPVLQRRYPSSLLSSPYQQKMASSECRWRSPSGSPLPDRSNFSREQDEHYGSTSPIVLQRFYHQQKQQQLAREAEEAAKADSGKKRFASYIKLQLSGERSGRNSRNQSPEPPPRFNRNYSAENQSPLAIRKNFFESNAPASPSLSRRYISPTPPIPPPRRLSESTSVPGSPQHLRTRFHYTPEPQRRLFHNSDVS